MDDKKLLNNVIRKFDEQNNYDYKVEFLGARFVGKNSIRDNIFCTHIIFNKNEWNVFTETSFDLEDHLCGARIAQDVIGLCVDGFANAEKRVKSGFWVELVKKVGTGMTHCLLCGHSGFDMAVKFYCSNKFCRNFHP